MIKKKALPKKLTAPLARRRGTFGDLDFEAVRELARIAAEFDLSEVETDPTGRIRVSRRLERAGAALAAAPVAASSPAISLVTAAAAEKAADSAATINSPFVGTFYRSPSPDAPMFVDVGQAIRKGQVVMTEPADLPDETAVEAMARRAAELDLRVARRKDIFDTPTV